MAEQFSTEDEEETTPTPPAEPGNTEVGVVPGEEPPVEGDPPPPPPAPEPDPEPPAPPVPGPDPENPWG
jgi:hypothetical protein